MSKSWRVDVLTIQAVVNKHRLAFLATVHSMLATYEPSNT